MRASRLLSLLLLLQTRGRMTARQLADELEVSLRTIYRDVESLSAAGVPVYADRGPDGGYQLLDGYRTRLTGLTTDEADTLFLTGIPGPATELGLGADLATAELKLLAALPPPLRTRAERVRERFHLDPQGWFHHREDTPHLAATAQAVWERHRITIRYQRWQHPREVTRTLEPLGLVLKAGRWYLIAQADDRIRTYRVARILDLHTLPERFDRPHDFDLAAYWRQWAERFEADSYPGTATIRLSPEGQRRAQFLLPPVMARAAHDNAGPPDPDGWIQATIPTESVRHAHSELLKLGTDAEVLAPPELRDLMTATACGLARLYQAPPTSDRR
ncbi:Predicted DNA-binding transcriptional regulator YafY, contains an HTH and WYL domains [Thermomonospora echinospora]|uniref:Predicted DNA-binding transcriptional regulator YafY, contains an HTH and WYL domains n=1 Tax=Thermomonospora echinospora TaxID=1992 RepID=A0A1H6D8P9_9ACTN|nr:YafY family protein [Thermomonospora echinospora]SEG81612.1 Predicted DNA-binding transcriptional regulator YafY, contains an HTH and WYL domains [Thermomonospora echinospora]